MIATVITYDHTLVTQLKCDCDALETLLGQSCVITLTKVSRLADTTGVHVGLPMAWLVEALDLFFGLLTQAFNFFIPLP